MFIQPERNYHSRKREVGFALANSRRLHETQKVNAENRMHRTGKVNRRLHLTQKVNAENMMCLKNPKRKGGEQDVPEKVNRRPPVTKTLSAEWFSTIAPRSNASLRTPFTDHAREGLRCCMGDGVRGH
jgi:hypothetical protein